MLFGLIVGPIKISADYIFQNCSSLVSIDLSNFDVSKVTSLYRSFYGCKSLISIDLSMLNVENVNDFSYLFYDCISLQSINIKNWRLKSATNLYSRQIFTYGKETMDKIVNMRSLIIGLKGLGIEIAKNIMGPAIRPNSISYWCRRTFWCFCINN